MTRISVVRTRKPAVLILVLLALFSSPVFAQAPTISSISPTTGVVGMVVQITGTGFGATQGTSTASLNGTNAVAVTWSDTRIAAVVPSGATSGPFSVVVGGQATSSSSFTVTALPSAWTDADVGSVGATGSASYASGTFTVQGAGNGITGTADSFHFVYQPVSGNGSLVARVVNEPTSATAGVMVRQTLAAGAMNGETVEFSNGGGSAVTRFYTRTTTGGTEQLQAGTGVGLPYWVELVWSGNTFTSYQSPDGVNWVQLGSSVTITMGSSVDVGLVVTSGSTSTLATATFDNVSLNLSGTPAPVITGVSATTGNVGSQVTINGSGFGATQGSSIVTLNAVPVTINAWSDQAIVITIPSGATTGPLVVSVGPSMNDSNPMWFTVTAQPLPTGWLDGDVGLVGKTGSASYASGTFTVQGAGNGITGTADSFHFVYQPVSGDGSLVARVVSAPSGATAGVMVRQTLAAGSSNGETVQFSQGGSSANTYFYARTTTGGSESVQAGVGSALPYWVKLVRSGNTFSSFRSSDGVNWTQLGSS